MTAALQSITHNLPGFIRDPAIALIGQECYTTLIYNVDFSSQRCIRLFISKGLGLGIVVFGSIMKLPQMIKIVNAQSAKGISLTMYALEVWAYTVSLIYAYRSQLPFSTYGENASLTLQSECRTTRSSLRTSCFVP
jgi:mannose-P-dolichol utilization defect protein 1